MQDTVELLSVARTDDAQNAHQQHTIRHYIFLALQNYFSKLGDSVPSNVYDLVLSEVEAPLLEFIMQQTRGNQTQAAFMLGLSRGTLRKLLKKYNLD